MGIGDSSIKNLTGGRTERADMKIPKPLFVPLTVLPPAPEWLPNGAAINEWNRAGQILVNARLLTDASLEMFGVYCSLHGRMKQAINAGETPKSALVNQLRMLANDFRLTPQSQGRSAIFAAEQAPEQENPFARNGKRPGS